MPLLPILKYPDPKLRTLSEPVTVFDEELKQLAADMRETMLAAPGAGLAAPQVGRFIRMIVIDGTEEGEEYGHKVITLINPIFLESEGEQIDNEGCLSVTDLQAPVHRYLKVRVRAQDVDGSQFEIRGEGRRAVILQHEIDHLNGILFIDHLSQVKRDMYKRRLKKMAKNRENNLACAV